LLSGALLLLLFVVMHAFADMFSKYDDPARLEVPVHVTVTNGFTIRWVEKSAGTNARLNLVFVHGSPGGAGVWASQFRAPYPNANLFAYDRPGFGGSRPALPRPHLQMQVDALMAWLPAATPDRVLLVGHSYGSPIALLAALEHPEKIGGVLLIGGDVDPALERPWYIQYVVGWRLTSWLLPRALRQCNREMLTVRADLVALQPRLSQLAVPVVMLHGGRDPLVPVANVAWLGQQLAAAGKSPLFAKIIHPEYNHFIPWEHPDAVATAIQLLVQQSQNQPVSNP
jgi:pimeloyl-ACP methyl ester carboxylesterase